MLVENAGSAARDWCMLERNILSHLKLALLLSLLSSSVLLRARLSSDPQSEGDHHAMFPAALVLVLSALLALAAGTWEYWTSDRDMRARRAFMIAGKVHVVMLTIVSGMVLVLCFVLLVDSNSV